MGILAKPLTNLLKKGGYHWSRGAKEAFQQLKRALIEALVLALPNMTKPFVIQAYASQTDIGVVLMQNQHPIAFISKMLSQKNQLLSV